MDTTGQGDFTSLQQASDTLSSRGVDGKVTIAIEPGVYKGGIKIDSIPGTSDTHTVSFASSTGDSADVTLVRDVSSSEDTLATIGIHSTDHLYIEELTITGKQDVMGIRIYGTARDIHINRSTIDSDREGIRVENVGYKEGVFDAPFRIEVARGIHIKNNTIQAHGGIFLRHDGSFSDLSF